MATTEFSHSESYGLRHFVEAGFARVAAVWTAVKNRRSVNNLLYWDDRMLSDIVSGSRHATFAGRSRRA